jgi:DNA-binding NtrC family response regulator
MRLLLVEDKDSFRRLLLKALEGASWKALAAADPDAALKILESTPIDAMVTDLRLPGFSGLELLRRARRFNPDMRIILMSAYGEPKDIVEAMRLGADDFLPKPFDLDVFLSKLEKIRALRLSPPPSQSEPWIVASKPMRALENSLRAAAETDMPVLFAGPAGAGRSRAARRLHLLRHPAAPFHSEFAHSLLPESLSDSLLSDLCGGSFLVKGLESLPSASLPALLSAMERRPGPCWMATCGSPSSLPVPLRSTIGALCLQLAPLAERKDDLIPLFYAHLAEACGREGRIAPTIGPRAEKDLLARPWPGNVAELAWAASESAAACLGGVLQELPQHIETGVRPLRLPMPKKDKLNKMLKSVAASAEKCFLQGALADAEGNPAQAAAALGMPTKAYIQKLKDYGILLEYSS